MELKDKTICVYGASSATIDTAYNADAYRLGELLAQEGASIICGGGRAGLMAAITDGVLSEGGKAYGVLPQFMIDAKWQHPGLTETVVTETMHERKMLMATRASGAVALPGGVGTFDELFEIITWRQLGLFNHPLAILNTNNYYEPLINMISEGVKKHFINDSVFALFEVADTPEEVVEYIKKWTPESDMAARGKKTY